MLSFGRGHEGLPGSTAGEATDTDGSGPPARVCSCASCARRSEAVGVSSWLGGRLPIRALSRAIVVVSAPLKSSERWFTNSWANALAMSAERFGLPAVASIAMMLLWLSGCTLIEPRRASRLKPNAWRVRTRSAT